MFRLVEQPTLMPACTLLRSTVGPVVDTEVILRNGGRVYVNELEAGEIVKFFPDQITLRAEQMGWASPETVAGLETRVADLERQLADARSAQPVVVPLDDVRQLLAVQ